MMPMHSSFQLSRHVKAQDANFSTIKNVYLERLFLIASYDEIVSVAFH